MHAGAFVYLEDGQKLRHYKVLRVLGSGGFGVTYLARDETEDKFVAIKEYFPADLAVREGATIHPRATRRDDFVWGKERFVEEALTLGRFDHPNIVRVFQIFEENDTAYMALEYESGRNLKEWLAEIGDLPTQKELDLIVTPLLDALEVIHKNGTLHRDIAPDNIYIRDDGSPVLLDFGSARQMIAERTKVLSAIVKSGYSPPEQYATRGRLQGPWSDIYALAATLYQAVTGSAPQESTDRQLSDDHVTAVRCAKPQYRPTFLQAIDWGLRLRWQDRPQTIADWRAALLGTKSVAEDPPSASMESRSIPRPSDAVLILSTSALFSAILTIDVPWDLLAIGDTSLLPGIFFGLIICCGLLLWEKRILRRAVVVTLFMIVVAWVCAFNVASMIVKGARFELATAVGGLAGGFVGSSITAAAVAISSSDVRNWRFILRTALIGSVVGIALVTYLSGIFAHYNIMSGLIFLIWQPAVAGSIAYAIAKSKWDREGANPRKSDRSGSLEMRLLNLAGAATIATLMLGGHGLYLQYQFAKAKEVERVQYMDASSKNDHFGLQLYASWCTACEYKQAAEEQIERLKEAEYFSFEVCNTSKYAVSVAVAGRKDTASVEYTVQGWWRLSPAACATIGRYARAFIYGIAKVDGDARGWRGNAAKYCVSFSKFERTVAGENENCKPSETLEGFEQLSAGEGAKYTWNIAGEAELPKAEFDITNGTESSVQIVFYKADTREQLDPESGQAYILDKRDTYQYRVSCMPGQNVCYGSFPQDNVLSAFWGLGYNGKQDCSNCCMKCPQGAARAVTATLAMSDARTPLPTVTWVVSNKAAKRLSLGFYSPSRPGWGFPRWDQQFTLDDGQSSRFTVPCELGSQVCWGAWPVGELNTLYWGTGPFGKNGCKNCCELCDGSTHVVAPFVSQ